MNWEAIGAIGEVLGAVGVLVTLVYLSIQVRSNTAQTHNATIESVMTADANARHELIDGPIPHIMAALQAGEEISRDEKQALMYHYQAYLQGWEVAFYLNEKGSLPEDVLNAIAFRRMAAMLTIEKEIPFSSISAGYTPAFIAHVSERWDDFMSKPKPWELDQETL